MIKNDDPVYGKGYREIKKTRDEIGWNRLIKRILF